MKINVLYISDVNASEPLFHSQVLAHVDGLKEFFNVKVLCLSRGENFHYDFTYKSIPGDYELTIGYLNFLKNYNGVKNFLKENKFQFIYSRGFRGGLVGSFIKKYYYRGKVPMINDVRGDALDEHNDSKLLQLIFRRSTTEIFKNSNGVFFVSSFLKKKYLQIYEYKGKAQVFPTFVANNKFIFSEQSRVNFRNKLGFSDENIVLLYSGSLSKWQNIDFILESFVKSSNPNLRLLILTKDYNINNILSKIDDYRVSSLSVDYENIQEYYFAADYGLLIRDNIDTNKAAAPTKFAEYVNSGLPLILNQIEADYIEIFKGEKIHGILLNNKEELNQVFDDLTKTQRNLVKINQLSDIILHQKAIIENFVNI